jgi:hypothetical protein
MECGQGGGPAAAGARRRSAVGALSHLGDAAGVSLMPAFDRLATTLIGDNPALTEALRCRRRLALEAQPKAHLLHFSYDFPCHSGHLHAEVLCGGADRARAHGHAGQRGRRRSS